MIIYVRALHKHELNNRLAACTKPIFGSIGRPKSGTIDGSSVCVTGEFVNLDSTLPDKTEIALYDVRADGAPVVKAYGIWQAKIRRVK